MLTLQRNNPGRINFGVNLRTISENKPHPGAGKTELRAPIPFSVGASFIQIVDDVIGVFFWVHGPGLIIWNWRTGRLVVVRPGYNWLATLSTGRSFA